MIKEIPSGKWNMTSLFESVAVAIEAGLDPTEFHTLSEDTRATYIAHARMKAVMTEYERFQGDKKSSSPSGGARTRKV
jgi:hypothetical protein